MNLPATRITQTPSFEQPCAPRALALIDEAHRYPGATHVVTRGEASELRVAAQVLRDALAPADPDRVEALVGKLAIAFPMQRISDAEAEVRLEQYRDGLDDVPLDVLTQAYRAAIRTRTFFPTVAELRALCPGLAQRRWRLSRIEQLLATHERGAPAQEERALALAYRPEPDVPVPRQGGTSTFADAARRAVEQARPTGNDTRQREGTDRDGQ